MIALGNDEVKIAGYYGKMTQVANTVIVIFQCSNEDLAFNMHQHIKAQIQDKTYTRR